MNDYQSKKLMVLDTEYDNNPKRLLALAYIVYTWDGEWKKDKTLQYVKHNSDVFSVDESGAAFEVHQLSNEFLDENGINIREVLENFYEKVDGVDIIIGHHPHVIQNMEKININNRYGYIFYSLGNFIFDSHYNKKGVRDTMILKIIWMLSGLSLQRPAEININTISTRIK